ncbi:MULTISPECIES: TetR/AcrR family transcriptional regulator [Listeria]|uniref:TetR/AcrR family transcriptional regulator n=1 Tax=Listeria TaxID=1637 RepID=UPI000B58BDBD|nr:MULTISPECIES: TetR/AcrR family transcriptional regulator [Listeria]
MSSRDLIIKSAIEVISEAGIQNYSLAKVAKNAGITKAAIFYYFKNKEELTKSLIAHTIDAYNKILTEEYEKRKNASKYPFTEAYIAGNLRQLEDDDLIGLHAALLASVITLDVDNEDWNAVYDADHERLIPEIGPENANFVRYTIDGMWHTHILGIKQADTQKVAKTLLKFVSKS